MAQFKKFSAIIIFSLFTICYATNAITNSKICNGVKYDEHSPIALSISYVQDDVASYTSYSFDYYSQSPGDTNVAYAHGVCYEGILPNECDDCMIGAYADLYEGCPLNTGAQVQLHNCRMRYEIYPFME